MSAKILEILGVKLFFDYCVLRLKILTVFPRKLQDAQGIHANYYHNRQGIELGVVYYFPLILTQPVRVSSD